MGLRGALGKVVHQKVIVFVGDALIAELEGRLTSIVYADFWAGFTDDQRSLWTQHVKLDFTDVRMAGSANPSDAE